MKRAEMKAGSMELRDIGSHANDVEIVCIAISLLNILGTALSASEAGGAEGAVLAVREQCWWWLP